VPALLRVLCLVALIFAAARPQAGTQLSPQRSRGIGILMLIDSSASMRTEDFEIDGETVSRIDAVKHVARQFIQGNDDLSGRPNDEIGLLAFTGYPVPSAPMTLDHGAVLEVLRSIEAPDPEKIERDARGQPLYPEEVSTAIGDAVALGADLFRRLDEGATEKVKSKVMILLSDGAQTMGTLSPEEGARIANAFGIKIYTIGIGQSGVIMVRVDDPLFGPRMVPRKSDLDEATLRAIADGTGGRYFNAVSTDALKKVYEEIDELEKSEIEATRFYQWEETFQPLALSALGLIFLEVLLAQTLFRRLP
jgi:Ca-activated chloride channel family protein